MPFRGSAVLAFALVALSQVMPAAAADAPRPVIEKPRDVLAEATGPRGAVVHYRPASVRGATRVVYSRPSGALFRLGVTVVNVTARASTGRTARARFTVTVLDRTAPALSLPRPIAVEATGPAGAEVTYTLPAAADLVDAAPTVSCAPRSGSVLPLGTNRVSCNARDAAGNVRTAAFDVVVVDTTAPAVDEPFDVLASTFGDSSAVEYALPVVRDTVDPNPTVACTPASGSAFGVGRTEVTCTARDAAGNTAATRFHVLVLRAPALPGTHSGTTSQGQTMWLTVYSDGITFGDIRLRVTASCPTGDMTLFVSPLNGRILLEPDGSFVLEEPMHGSTPLVSGWVSGKLAGRFITRESASGTFEAVFDRRVGSRIERCFTGIVSWSLTRSAT